MLDTTNITALQTAVDRAVDIMTDTANNIIVISGCGTSGRMAYFVARAYNQVLRAQGRTECVKYLVSGGDPALLLSFELPGNSCYSCLSFIFIHVEIVLMRNRG
jgi:N-acetylmuramic acid 6-phosphate (MurNAc-6-P) etherase